MTWALSTSRLSHDKLTKLKPSQKFLKPSLPLMHISVLQVTFKAACAFGKVCYSKLVLQCVGGRSRGEVTSHSENLAGMH